jgi:hypothetical protein
MEAKFYYARSLSVPGPVLVARTTTTPWEEPDSQGNWTPKELRPVGNHALNKVREDLDPRLLALLDSMKVKWTSIDVVRIGTAKEHSAASAPVIIWIGVMPESLSGNDGVSVATRCRELLGKYDITDVHVEIRESVARPVVGSQAPHAHLAFTLMKPLQAAVRTDRHKKFMRTKVR